MTSGSMVDFTVVSWSQLPLARVEAALEIACHDHDLASKLFIKGIQSGAKIDCLQGCIELTRVLALLARSIGR